MVLCYDDSIVVFIKRMYKVREIIVFRFEMIWEGKKICVDGLTPSKNPCKVIKAVWPNAF